eukprot:GDKI01018886.1.p1 GENE.GDKI01018886.1~~GDKI01018886.1.p1  ORF type:complete len:295 (-),score=58.00 GDKI01018886.1:739-1623(-)
MGRFSLECSVLALLWGVVVLCVNELRVIDKAEPMLTALREAIHVPDCMPNRENEGKLVYMACKVNKPLPTLRSKVFAAEFGTVRLPDALVLHEHIEMLQWMEYTDTKKGGGGGGVRFEKEWHSVQKRCPNGDYIHRNPVMVHKSNLILNAVSLNGTSETETGFNLATAQLRALWEQKDKRQEVPVPNPYGNAKWQFVPSNGYLYALQNTGFGRSVEDPYVGDYRVKWTQSTALTGSDVSVTVVAKQVGNSFEPMQLPGNKMPGKTTQVQNDRHIFWVAEGDVPLATIQSRTIVC